jgi:hypothetical protein
VQVAYLARREELLDYTSATETVSSRAVGVPGTTATVWTIAVVPDQEGIAYAWLAMGIAQALLGVGLGFGYASHSVRRWD